jgi:transcription elongation factor GreA
MGGDTGEGDQYQQKIHPFTSGAASGLRKQAAKRDRAHNESRIRYLEKMIRTSKLIKDTTSKNQVGIGKTVCLKFSGEEKAEKFEIVTTIEADPMNNRISIESPLGSAIYKHETGDSVPVKSPQGQYYVKIESIR